MIWVYSRGPLCARIELRLDGGTGEYVLSVHLTGHPRRTERYRDFERYSARVRSLEEALGLHTWRRQGLAAAAPAPLGPPVAMH